MDTWRMYVTASIVFVLPLALIGSVLLFNRGEHFRLDSDYVMLLPMVKAAYNAHVSDPSQLVWNPLVGTGIPVLGDPSSIVLSPFVVLATSVTDPENGIVVLWILSIALSGLSMWYFLRILGLPPMFQLYGAVIYQVSGGLSAAIAAGHVIKFLSYPLYPLLFSVLIQVKLRKAQYAMAGVSLALMIFHADVYGVWFFFLLFGSLRLYQLLRRHVSLREFFRDIIWITGIFFVVAGVKLVPYVITVRPIMERFFQIDAYAGSVHPFVAVLSYIMPFQVQFYDRPTVRWILGFWFNWYEYYAFITPLPFLFLLRVRSVIREDVYRRLLLLFVIGLLYVAVGYGYSPYHWLFEWVPVLLDTFRVPQRMLAYMTPIVIALVLLPARAFMKHKQARVHVMLMCTIVWLTAISFFSIQHALAPVDDEVYAVSQATVSLNSENVPVLVSVCCMQSYLIHENIPVVNMYYAWRPTNVPQFINEMEDGYDLSALSEYRPKFVLTAANGDITPYNYDKVVVSPRFILWQTDDPTIR